MVSRTFPVTPQQLDGLAAMLKGAGATMNPAQPHGEAKENGWDVSWDIANGQITVNLISHPFLEAGAFWSKVQNVLAPS